MTESSKARKQQYVQGMRYIMLYNSNIHPHAATQKHVEDFSIGKVSDVIVIVVFLIVRIKLKEFHNLGNSIEE